MAAAASAAITDLLPLQLRFITPAAPSSPLSISSEGHGQLKFFRLSQRIYRGLSFVRSSRGTGVEKKPGRSHVVTYCSSSSNGEAVPLPNSEPKKGPWSETFGRLYGSQAPSLSDIVWPSVGAFVAMAAMGYVDTLLAPKGLHVTLGSFGAVCTLLFAAPKAPSSQMYNVFVSHLGCAALGVAALAVFGPGWVARAVALAAAIAFMQYTGCMHPPAAGLPLILIDGQKMHHLQWWFVIYPGFAGCVFLFILQEVVQFLRDNWRF